MTTPPDPSSFTAPEERIDDVDITAEMQGSFLEYAYAVIYSRALPDARDGLKPVQRRILYQMSEMGLRPDRGHVKSARVVGEVMGKLHPHGDAPIYDALVRLAQDFTMRLPLVDGHGNFGSLDDGPAASRYTEARMAPAAEAMTDGLDEEVVDFVPNYDNQLEQPDVLPSAIPNLLVNGAAGIAVGMATNMPPHNLVEVAAGAKHLLENPEADVEQLMQFIPGPDLPGGGIIVGLDGVKEAYRTGRGAFRTRAKATVEQITPRKSGLVITELPYLVGPERVIEKIKDGVEAKRLAGISDVTDLSDRKHGLRLVIEIKTGFNPQAVLEQLYRYTPLEESFGVNNVALVEGQPQTLGLRELLRVFLDHRISVVRRRSQFRLDRRRERLHLVEGLLVAILDIDEVIQLIRTSDDGEQARSRLMSVFDLSQAQAEYILELRLRRLTKFSRIELETERDELLAQIAQLEEILASESRLHGVVAQELDEVAERFGTPRRTLLTGAAPAPARRGSAAAAELEHADTSCHVLLSATGRLLRVDPVPEGASGGGSRRTLHDAVLSALTTTTRATMGAVTSRGRLLAFSPVDLPAVPAASVQFAAGVKAADYLGLADKKERVLALVPLAAQTVVALGTRQGVVKRVLLGELPAARNEHEIIALKPGDEVVGAAVCADGDELVFVASDAQLLRFEAGQVRPQGRPAAGMAGIRLDGEAQLIWFGVVPADAKDDAVVATVAVDGGALEGTDAGSAKLSALSEFPAKGRGTGGVRAQRFLKGESRLAAAWAGRAPAIAVAADGGIRSLPDALARRDASGQSLDGGVAFIGSSIAAALSS